MRTLLSKTICYVAVVLLFGIQNVHAQATGPAPSVDKGTVCWSMQSALIGGDYTVYVHTPPGYDTSKVSYPVLYLTDGDWDENIAVNSFNMLRQDYITTEAVIVGIGYGERVNQRDRDLEPAKGAPAFLSFIETAVIPFIESKYKVTRERALSGYSYGGLFAAYALFSRPGLFSTICIGAPASSADLVPFAQQYFTTHKTLKTRLFLSVGAYEHQVTENLAQFKAYLLKQDPGQEVALELVPGAGHGAAKPQVIQEAVAFAFCKKHKPIKLPVAELEKYAGTYRMTGRPDKQIRFYLENGQLYSPDGNVPIEVVPYIKDGFFIYENEKADMLFKTENSKMYELYVPYGGKPVRFDKVEQ